MSTKTERPETARAAVFPPAMPFALEPMIATNQRNLRAAGDAMLRMAAQWQAVQAEMFRFLDHRLDADREAARALAGCGSPKEAMEHCARFMDTAVRAYAEEMGRIAGLCAEAAVESAVEADRAARPEPEPAAPPRKAAAGVRAENGRAA